jgi:hypothetical protein
MKKIIKACLMAGLSFLTYFPAMGQYDEPDLSSSNYGYFGLANTNTAYHINGLQLNGVGIIGGIRFSIIDLFANPSHLNKFIFTDFTTFDIGVGGRGINEAARQNPNIDSEGAYFFFSGNFGFESYYRFTEKFDLGGQIYYNVNYDDTRHFNNNTGADDNLMFGLHARYDRFTGTFNTKVPNNDKNYQQNQFCTSYALQYVYNKKSRKAFGLRYDIFTEGSDMVSSNIRIIWILPFL